MDIGNKIMELRKKNRLSQEELAEEIGVARQTISKWELGETSPDLKQAKELSKIFNISLDELVSNDIKEILVEKTSNTEKLAGLILKLIKVALVVVVVGPLLVITAAVIYRNIQKNNLGRVVEKNITCTLHDKTYGYGFNFYESTGEIKEAGGDGYLANITNVDRYSDAYQAIDVIDAYVKNNGGSCQVSEIREVTK